MDRFQYLALMAGCLLVTLPLEFWLSARVYRRPRRLFLAVVPVALLFIAWDLFAIQRNHWTFSPEHTTGIMLPGGIPLEEVVFFLVIPTCGLLTYEAVGTVLARYRRPLAETHSTVTPDLTRGLPPTRLPSPEPVEGGRTGLRQAQPPSTEPAAGRRDA